jgi:hypothetical protein
LVSAPRILRDVLGFDSRRAALSRSRLTTAIVLVHLLVLGIFAAASRTGFSLDDAWIFQRVARNFAETGVLGFTYGVASSGSTSILWPWLLALNYRLFHVDPVVYTLGLGIVSATVAGLGLRAILIADGFSDTTAAASAIAMAGLGNWMWLAVSGMESTLFVALGFWCVVAWQRKSPAACVLLGALLVLTRMEGVVLLGLLALASVKREWKLSAALLASASFTLLAVSLWSRFTRGSFMPTTMAGRQWLYAASGLPHWHRSLNLLISWMFRFLVENAGMQFMVFVASIATGVMVLRGSLLVARRGGASRVLLLWSLASLAMYAIVLPYPGNGGRYQPMLLALYAPLAVIGIAESVRSRARRAVLATLLLVLSVASLDRWRAITVASTDQINHVSRAMGKWLAANIPANEPIAAFDIGAIGYEFGRRPVVDLGGLVDASYLPYLRSGHVTPYLRDHRVAVVVLPEAAADQPALFPVYDFTRLLQPFEAATVAPIARFRGNIEGWELGFKTIQHVNPQSTAYRVSYQDAVAVDNHASQP